MDLYMHWIIGIYWHIHAIQLRKARLLFDALMPLVMPTETLFDIYESIRSQSAAACSVRMLGLFDCQAIEPQHDGCRGICELAIRFISQSKRRGALW